MLGNRSHHNQQFLAIDNAVKRLATLRGPE
jgi:hypothetical protein